MQSTLTVKGQTTIPRAVREHLGMKPGDKVKYLIRPDGRVVLLRVRPITELRGSVKYDGPLATIEDMDEAIGEGIAERYLRSGK